MIKSISAFALFVAIVSVALGASPRLHAAPVDRGVAGTVKITVNYKGSGKVDGSHRVWVYVFDTPDIGPGSMPIDETSVDKDGGVATFEVSAERVFIAVAYDEKGVMTGNAPPPSGTPIAIYGANPTAPEAVTPGAKGAVTLTFDDSLRMP